MKVLISLLALMASFGCAHAPTATPAPVAVPASPASPAPTPMVIRGLNPFYGAFYFALPADWEERTTTHIQAGGRNFLRSSPGPSGKPAAIALIPLDSKMPPVTTAKNCEEMGSEMATRSKVVRAQLRTYASGEFCEVSYINEGSEFKLVVLRARKNQFSALLAAGPRDERAVEVFDSFISSWGQVQPPR